MPPSGRSGSATVYGDGGGVLSTGLFGRWMVSPEEAEFPAEENIFLQWEGKNEGERRPCCI